jgi:hypothetical protein
LAEAGASLFHRIFQARSLLSRQHRLDQPANSIRAELYPHGAYDTMPSCRKAGELASASAHDAFDYTRRSGRQHVRPGRPQPWQLRVQRGDFVWRQARRQRLSSD